MSTTTSIPLSPIVESKSQTSSFSGATLHSAAASSQPSSMSLPPNSTNVNWTQSSVTKASTPQSNPTFISLSPKQVPSTPVAGNATIASKRSRYAQGFVLSSPKQVSVEETDKQAAQRKIEQLNDQNLQVSKDLLNALSRIRELEEDLQRARQASTSSTSRELSNGLIAVGGIQGNAISTESAAQFFQENVQKALLPHILPYLLSSQIDHSEMEKLAQENGALREKLTETEKKLILAEEGKEHLQEKLTEAEDAKEQLSKEKGDLQLANTKLNDEKTGLSSRNSHLEARKKDLKNSKIELQKERAELQKERTDLQKERDELQQQNLDLFEEKTYINLEKLQLAAMNNSLEKENVALQLGNVVVSQANASLTDQNTELAEQNAQLGEGIQTMNKTLRKERKLVKKQVANMQTELTERIQPFINGENIIIPRKANFFDQLVTFVAQKVGLPNDSAN